MASTVYNGTNLILKVIADGGTLAAIGHTTSCTISLTNDMADATTKDSSGFSESIAGLISGEISFDGLVDYTDSNGATELAGFLLGRTRWILAMVQKQRAIQFIQARDFLQD